MKHLLTTKLIISTNSFNDKHSDDYDDDNNTEYKHKPRELYNHHYYSMSEGNFEIANKHLPPIQLTNQSFLGTYKTNANNNNKRKTHNKFNTSNRIKEIKAIRNKKEIRETESKPILLKQSMITKTKELKTNITYETKEQETNTLSSVTDNKKTVEFLPNITTETPSNIKNTQEVNEDIQSPNKESHKDSPTNQYAHTHSNRKSVDDIQSNRKRGKLFTKQITSATQLQFKALANINPIQTAPQKHLSRMSFTPIDLLAHRTPKIHKDTYVKDFFGKIYSETDSIRAYSNNHHSFFFEQNIFNMNNFFLFGVFECEGPEGYHIASLAKMNLIFFFTSEMQYGYNKDTTAEDIYMRLTEKDYDLIKRGFAKVSSDIISSRKNSDDNGGSISLIFTIGHKVICASLGTVKSIAMIHREVNDLEMVSALNLSAVHTLDNPSERKRIELHNQGIVTLDSSTNKYSLTINRDNSEEEDEDDDSDYNAEKEPEIEHITNMSITRGLGMKHLIPYGLISLPEIKETTISKSCKCLFICNKSFYETMSSTFILKFLCLGLNQREKISTTAHRLIDIYKKRLKTHHYLHNKNTFMNDCVYLMVYF